MTNPSTSLLTKSLHKSLPILLSLVLTGCIFDKKPNYEQQPTGFAEQSQKQLEKMDDPQRLRMAKRFEEGGDYSTALKMYAQILQNDTNSTAAMFGAGRIYMAGGAYARAARFYQRALVAEPTNSTAIAGMAEALIMTDRAEEAMAMLERFGADGQVRTAKYHNMLGVAYDLSGRHGDAQIAYSQALDLDSLNSSTISNMALSFAISAQYDTAISLLQQLVNSVETRSLARQNLALVYALSGELDAAQAIAKTELSEEQVNTNRYFYSRLAELDGPQRARAVYLRQLPPLEEFIAESEQVLVADAGKAPEATVEGATVVSRPLTEEELMRNRISAIISSEARPVEELPTDTNIPAAEATSAAPEVVVQDDAVAIEAEIMVAENLEVPTASSTSPAASSTSDDIPTPAVADREEELSSELPEAVADTEVPVTDVESVELPDPVYWVQLGSYGSRARAQSGWDILTTRQVALFGALDGFTQEIDNAEGASNYRLFAAGYPGFTAAKVLCQAMKDSGVDCLVIETSDRIEPLYRSE